MPEAPFSYSHQNSSSLDSVLHVALRYPANWLLPFGACPTTCPAVPSYGYEDYIPAGTTILAIGTGGILDAQLTSLFRQIIASITFPA